MAQHTAQQGSTYMRWLRMVEMAEKEESDAGAGMLTSGTALTSFLLFDSDMKYAAPAKYFSHYGAQGENLECASYQHNRHYSRVQSHKTDEKIILQALRQSGNV